MKPLGKPSKTQPLDAASISRFKKEKYLAAFTEDDFRDLVVRPIFLRKGFLDGRDLCGPSEEGKDCIFFQEDLLGRKLMYAVQTKRGNLNMTRKNQENVVEAQTQLATALNTVVTIAAKKERHRPTCVILCVSGKINKSAREHIVAEVKDPRVEFLDADDLIPDVDEHYPEFWYGIDADKFPYLDSFKKELLRASDTLGLSELGLDQDNTPPITEERYIPLYLDRIKPKVERHHGKVYRRPVFEQSGILDVLKKRETLILIVGDAGSGKTTSLRRIAYHVAETTLLSATSENSIPIFIRAIDVDKSADNLVTFAMQASARFSPTQKSCFSARDLVEGYVILLIDALDELPTEEQRKNVVGKILAFHRDYPKCRVIATSRDYSFTEQMSELGNFARFNISPFDLKQTEKLVNQLVRGRQLSVESVNEMLRRLQDVHGMDLNPLLVTVFVATSEIEREDVPANITELFKKFTELMLGRWDMRKGLSQQVQAPLKDFLLCRLAFEMHSERTTIFSLAEARRLMERELTARGRGEDFNVLFDEIVNRSGLLRLDGDDVRFRHLLLQEFFAGRGTPSKDHLRDVLHDRWWKEAIVFYFGQNPSDHATLASLTRDMPARTAPELYQAACTVGLALQACYMSIVSEKTETLVWVIRTLAGLKEDFLKAIAQFGPQIPLMSFLQYYIFARDSVATRIVNQAIDRLEKGSGGGNIGESERFWCIIGLIESGQLDLAEAAIKKFKPEDNRLLLSIHLGCFVRSHLRISSPEQKAVAERIYKKIEPKVSLLMDQVVKEMRGLLLEVQKGEVKALDAPAEEKKPKAMRKGPDAGGQGTLDFEVIDDEPEEDDSEE